MSKYDFDQSRELMREDPPFFGIIMAAMRKADDVNLRLLKMAWPEVWEELEARYWSPSGVLESEGGAPSER